MAAVVAVSLVLLLWRPWQPESCGQGLKIGPGGKCVGLDVESNGFGDSDPLAALEQRIAQMNARITGRFVTLVLLDNITPDADQDSDDLRSLTHRIQGALTAVWRANTSAAAGGSETKIKLLLASHGSGAGSWEEAVGAIKEARASERIAGVIGIGQSLDNNRAAVAALSDAGIATIASVATADNMTTDREGRRIENFFRIAPTNTDQARAIVEHIDDRGYEKVMLIEDLNKNDHYPRTLAAAFSKAYEKRRGDEIEYTSPYRSSVESLQGTSRHEYMTSRFSTTRGDICALRPDAVFFAGRSMDLKSFLRTLSEGGACGLDSLDVFAADDASNLAGDKLPAAKHLKFRVFYTGLAHGGQWTGSPSSNERRNYDSFAEAFVGRGFTLAELEDGHAMMSHDAAITAVLAVRRSPVAATDPSTVGDQLLGMRCTNAAPGASGTIALGENGNPHNKAMPMLELLPNGTLEQHGLIWPEGAPFDLMSTCG